MRVRKRSVLARSWARSSPPLSSSSSALSDAATIGGASVLENRYGRERWRSSATISPRALV